MNSNTMDFSVITESDIDPGYMSMNNKRVRHFVQRYPSVGNKSSVKNSCQKIIQQLKILWTLVSDVSIMKAINFKCNPWRHIEGLITTGFKTFFGKKSEMYGLTNSMSMSNFLRVSQHKYSRKM